MRTSVVPSCGVQPPPQVVVIGTRRAAVANRRLPCTSLWPCLKPESASLRGQLQFLLVLPIPFTPICEVPRECLLV